MKKNEEIYLLFSQHLDEIKELILQSTNIADALRRINKYVNIKRYDKFHELVNKFDIDISHFIKYAWNKGKTKETDKRIKKCVDTYKRKYQNGEIKAGFINKQHSEETKKRIAKSVKKHFQNEKKEISSIKELSKRTVTKIFQRMNLGCSRCGWNESTCDLHHIHGRKIENADDHSNLCYICPNCHRLIHTHKISTQELEQFSLDKIIKDKWREFYYWND